MPLALTSGIATRRCVMHVDGIRITSPTAKIFLDLSQLDEDAGRAWRDLVELAVRAVGLAPTIFDFSGRPPDDGDTFAFVADSAALTRKLLFNIPRLYVAPRSAPGRVDALVHSLPLAEELPPEPVRSKRRVTLVSSIYNGDEYLDGFLSNMATLHGYEEFEHLLIRAGSPGNEHGRLVDHVLTHPGAAYIHLARDPGLYAVWNLGARLATGRYLSNANIDDRRDPEHVAKLQAVLDAKPEISVASASLRVSTQKNLSWEDSSGCPLMFPDTPAQEYQASSLFRHTRNGLASRNLPHCMPIWRRGLHVFSGGFNERRYGPSADWAFWLRAGRRGIRYYFSDEPLGLYLRDDSTYWRRNKDNAGFDLRIVTEFGDVASGNSLVHRGEIREEQLLCLELVHALDALRHGAMLEGMGRLLLAAAGAKDVSATASRLMNKACRRFFGCMNGLEWVARFKRDAGMETLPDQALFKALVDLIYGYDVIALGDAAPTVRRNLAMACMDWQECFSDGHGLSLLALLTRECAHCTAPIQEDTRLLE